MLEPELPCEGFWEWELYFGKGSSGQWTKYTPQKKEPVTVYPSEYSGNYLIVHPKFYGNGNDKYCPKNMKGHSWNVRKEQITFNTKNKPCRMRTTHVRVRDVNVSV